MSAASPTEQLCLRLVYRSIQQALSKTKADEPVDNELLEILGMLADADKEQLVCGRQPQAFPLAVACWLRERRELGNRTVAAQILGVSARKPACQPFCRAAATKVLALPTDLADVLDICWQNTPLPPGSTTKPGPPHCLKKAADDLFARLTPFQAAKYDSSTTMRTLKRQVTAKKELLNDVTTGAKDPAKLAKRAARQQAKGKGKGRASKGTSQVLADQFSEKQLTKDVDRLVERVQKLHRGSLTGAMRSCHVSQCSAEVYYGLKRKKYPGTEEDFKDTGLKGEFDEASAGKRITLWEELGGDATTWDRELSQKGNVITTWRELLLKRQVPYMAMLRNLNNIIMQGFSIPFLELHVFKKLLDEHQIRGSGQTAQQILHSLSAVEEMYNKEKLDTIAKKSKEHIAMICVCYRLLRKLRSEGIVGGRSDVAPGLIGEFLGYPIWKAAGFPLDRINGVFMQYEEKEVRGAAKRSTVSRTMVPLSPPTSATIDAVRQTLHQAAELAAVAVVEEIPWPQENRVVLWYDVSAQDAEKVAPEMAALDPCGPDSDMSKVVRLDAGGLVPLEQISSCTKYCFELQYSSESTVDFNLHAFNRKGQWLFNSSYQDSRKGGEKWNKKGEKIVIHSKDVKGGSPAIRCMHVDLGGMQELGPAPGAAEAEKQACHFVFCMDDSGSMRGTPWEELTKAYTAFLDDRLAQDGENNDLVSIIVFNTSARTQVRAEPLSSKPMPKYGGGGTKFAPALQEALKVLEEVSEGVGILIFMSDGCAGDLALSLPLARQMRETYDGLQTHFVGFGRGVNESELRSLAQETAGLHHPARDGGQLLSIFTDIAVSTNLNITDKKVFALMLSSQNFNGKPPTKASICVRECPYGFEELHAGHDPDTIKRGSALILSDVTELMAANGTCVHGMLYRSSGSGWMYRNSVDESLKAESRMAYQATRVCGQIFRSIFGELSLKSTFDPEKTAALRVCQFNHAFAKHGKVEAVVTGVPYTSVQPALRNLAMSGNLIEDFKSVYDAGRELSKRSASPSQIVDMLSLKAGDLVVRIASNAAVPATPAGVRYAQVDMRGDAAEHLHEIPASALLVPGGAEACLKVLRNCLRKDGAGLLDHVASFLPPNKPPRCQECAAQAAENDGKGVTDD
mmetsp:Transcript_46309/g.107760  ORF Transcript_46309/g.107760 Transcript_46309/m.107760 type:complete len:1137 (-) Transcript_46309:94-3504(-)